MEVRELKKAIKDGQLRPFYVFTGEEIEAQRIYIDKIAEVTGRIVTRLDTVADVLKYRVGIVKQPRLFVVMDDKDFMTAEKAWDSIEELLKDKMLILQITSLDKRLKFAKRFAEATATFNFMSDDVLYKYVQKKCALGTTASEDLISICGNDYGRILLEIDKIQQCLDSQRAVDYTSQRAIDRQAEVNEPLTSRVNEPLTSQQTVDQIFYQLVSEGVIYRQPQDAIFALVDAIIKADPKRAYRLLEDCKAIEESPLAILTVLYNNFKRVLQVQTCNSSDICKATGLNARDVAITKKLTGYWDSRDIVYFLRKIQSIERAIKTGEIEDCVAVEYALSCIF